MSFKVLTVDDSRTIREMVRYTLLSEGYEIDEAADGQKALEMAKSKQYDYVITDLNMPKMDGVDLITHLRAHKNYQTTPILMLTTEFSGDEKEKGKAAGATGWIVKPFDPDKLISTLHLLTPQGVNDEV